MKPPNPYTNNVPRVDARTATADLLVAATASAVALDVQNGDTGILKTKETNFVFLYVHPHWVVRCFDSDKQFHSGLWVGPSLAMHSAKKSLRRGGS